jgi:hypothetical protein
VGGDSTAEARSPLGPGVAEADGIPAEIWIVQPDGSGLRRLTNVQQHSPIPAWSPIGIVVLKEECRARPETLLL